MKPVPMNPLLLLSVLSFIGTGSRICSAWVSTSQLSSRRQLQRIETRTNHQNRLQASVSAQQPSSSRANNGSSRRSSSRSQSNTNTGTKPSNAVSWDWEAVSEAAFAESTAPIVLFDGVCNFCSEGVNLCLDLDDDEIFRFCSLQSQTGQSLLLRAGKQPDDLSSLVLVTNPDQAYFHSTAVLRVIAQLTGLPSSVRSAANIALQVVPPLLRDPFYYFVSANRHWWGSEEEDGPTCRMDFDGTLAARFVQDPLPQEDEVGDAVQSF